ncbi:hypothetical protein BDV30DRAFT_49800 [Aspergillus minisclerotigenes]|uniref:Uncharacterized protein n=1 Tax=Aspergillus minisclerotigenes TaxID=656917 RepID=A0A5N6IKE5_9EURO|nr:hypothetical protein BDV30DRAFT_49800 [Aspergillus minisclerotigenes]
MIQFVTLGPTFYIIPDQVNLRSIHNFEQILIYECYSLELNFPRKIVVSLYVQFYNPPNLSIIYRRTVSVLSCVLILN